jgi:hypothetical protein
VTTRGNGLMHPAPAARAFFEKPSRNVLAYQVVLGPAAPPGERRSLTACAFVLRVDRYPDKSLSSLWPLSFTMMRANAIRTNR